MPDITDKSSYFEYNKARPMTMPSQHYHNFYEIYFLEKGSGKYFIDNRVYAISENDLILIPKGIIHKTSYPADSDNNLRQLLSFSSDYISPPFLKDMTKLFSKHIYRPDKQTSEMIKGEFNKIEKEYMSPDALSEELIRCAVSELFSIIIRKAPLEINECADSYNDGITKVIDYINRNFPEDISLEKMAEIANMHRCYFSRMFKEFTGFGFKEYVTILRLKKAQSFVVGSKKSVSDIAFECGFNDSNYFSLVFSRYFGCSPLKYRKKYTK